MGQVRIQLEIENIDATGAKAALDKIMSFLGQNANVKLQDFSFRE